MLFKGFVASSEKVLIKLFQKFFSSGKASSSYRFLVLATELKIQIFSSLVVFRVGSASRCFRSLKC